MPTSVVQPSPVPPPESPLTPSLMKAPRQSSPPWPSVAIVGVGLIGGSVGLALKARRLVGHVIGVGRTPASLAEARQRGIVDETTTDLAAGVAQADLVVVASAVSTIGPLLDRIDEAARPGTLLTDAGSTKGSIVARWERRRKSRRCR